MSHILVLGDVFRDNYYIGSCTKLSPEGPIPVVKVNEVISTPGGAGNVAENLKALSEQVTLLSGSGLELPTKNRLMVGNYQLARWDSNDQIPSINSIWLDYALRIKYDAIIIADYAKGSISCKVVSSLPSYHTPIFVDTKRNPMEWFGIAHTLFPNAKEYAEFKQEYDKFPRVVVKRGAEGLTYRWFGKEVLAIPARTVQVRSVVGAGDTVIAAYVSQWLVSASEQARCLEFANDAAAVAVSKPYTSVATREEIDDLRARFE